MTRRTTTHTVPRPAVLSTATAVALIAAGCSVGGGARTEAQEETITLVTHDSFSVSEELLASFTEETGVRVEQVAPGDGGALVNQLVLTKDSPMGDVAYGVSGTYASRALDEGVFAAYDSPALPESAQEYEVGEGLTPIDVSDVCLNVDLQWFEEQGVPAPATFDDLLEPEYEGLTVVTNPATSSPGLDLLVATVAAKGEDGFEDYWAKLRDNGLKVVDGWSDAYYVDFTGAGGDGDRPVALSYSSSPPSTLDDAGEPRTAALLDTCARQVEYAGVLEGAANPEGAKKFVDFLLSEEFQAELPGSMYVYPIDDSVALPEDWERFAPRAERPWTMTSEEIDAGRAEWIEKWTAVVEG